MAIEIAAGVLCWRRTHEGLEVLLVHRPRYDDWSWPKGKAKADESLPCTAVREACEETGLAVALGRPLAEVRYRLPDGRRKRVVYWAATGRERLGAAAGGTPEASGTEVDQIAWLPPREAQARLAWVSDAEPLRVLERLAAADELATAPVLVVRHGTSRPRDSWSKADADRPLISAGRRQARGLIPLLACWAPERVVSSPWRRCLDTIAPFAASAGLPVQTKGALSEDGARRAPQRVRRQVHRLLDGARSAALCTHRPVLGEVFDVIRSACRAELRPSVPAKDPYLAPGEVLVAHIALGSRPPRVAAVERHHPQR